MRIVTAVFLAAACMALPAKAQYRGGVGPTQDNYGPTPHQTPDDGEAPAPASHDLASFAEDLRLKGRCDRAVPLLRPMAERGNGHEIEQYDLGLCLFDLARAEHDEKHAADLTREGADWVVHAANGGFAKAQAMAVSLYLDGKGVAADPTEAEKWALLYHRNGMRLGIGLPDTTPELRKRLDAAMNDTTEAEAKKRARDWTPPAPVEE
jgi:TPR repeat protein